MPQSHPDQSLMPPITSLPSMSHEHNTKHKRVWVPYNKKMKLRGMQQTMQGMNHPQRVMRPSNSNHSGNPLLNSN